MTIFLFVCRLGTGWSIHTAKMAGSPRKQQEQLSYEEQQQIMRVIQKAEMLENMEHDRIG